MEWLLTDEEIKEIYYAKDTHHPTEVCYMPRNIAKAQAKKLVEWGDGQCDDVTHDRPFWIRRFDCEACRQSLRKEVGLE